MKVSAGATFLTLLYFLIFFIGFIAETYYYKTPIKHIFFGSWTYSYFLTGIATLGFVITAVCSAAVLLYLAWAFLHLIGDTLVNILEKKDS